MVIPMYNCYYLTRLHLYRAFEWNKGGSFKCVPVSAQYQTDLNNRLEIVWNEKKMMHRTERNGTGWACCITNQSFQANMYRWPAPFSSRTLYGPSGTLYESLCEMLQHGCSGVRRRRRRRTARTCQEAFKYRWLSLPVKANGLDISDISDGTPFFTLLLLFLLVLFLYSFIILFIYLILYLFYFYLFINYMYIQCSVIYF